MTFKLKRTINLKRSYIGEKLVLTSFVYICFMDVKRITQMLPCCI